MSIVSWSDLSTYMGGPNVTPNQQSLITDTIIPGVQQELELYLNTPVELVQVRESLTPEQDGYVYFTYAPVRKLISASWSVDGAQPITLVQYEPDPVAVDPSVNRPVIDRTATAVMASSYRYPIGLTGFPGVYASGVSYVVFDYIAGYDGTNDKALKLALLRVTAREVEREFDTTTGIRDGSLEPAGQSDDRPKGWTDDELKQFSRLKRRVIL